MMYVFIKTERPNLRISDSAEAQRDSQKTQRGV